MKKHSQQINQILGFWLWFCLLVSLTGSFFLLFVFRWTLFEWEKKVIPAFRKMMAGGPGSYLRLSGQGLVYRNWPYNEIRCDWEAVHCVHKSRWFGSSLFLQHAEESGFPEFTINLSQQQIHLDSLVGWPDGGIEDDLRQFAPHLFGS